MDGGGGSAIVNGLHVLIPCETQAWHEGDSMVDPHSYLKNKNVKNERKKKIASAQDAGGLDMSTGPVR